MIDPTAQDWENAKREAAKLDRPVAPKALADLVPGDAFAARSRVYVVTGWPTIYGSLQIVTVPIAGSIREAEFALDRRDRTVPTWVHERIGYGHVRCPGCRWSVGRDHRPYSDECQEAQDERQLKHAAE